MMTLAENGRIRDGRAVRRAAPPAAIVSLPLPDLAVELDRSRTEVERLLEAERVMRATAEASQQRFRDLVEGLNALVWEADGVTYQMTFVSGRCLALFGYRPEEWLADPGFWEGHLHPDDREATVRACDTAIAELRGVNLEYRFRRRDGTYVWIRDVIMVTSDPARPRRLTGVMVDISDRKVLEDELEHRATRDSLTGLPNRSFVLDRIGAALGGDAPPGSLALLFIDLDDFKRVNDSLGHGWGDRLLQMVAERLAAGLRPADRIGRLGGDEFVVLLGGDGGREEARPIADRLLKRVSAPFRLGSREVVLTASIGIALDDGSTSDAEELVRNADLAMSYAKAAGKGRVLFFEPAMHTRVLDRLTLEGELRRAIRRQELEVAYQPIVDLADGRIISVEALARWNPATRGTIPPSDFIPVAEQTGLIVPLGRWIVTSACRQVRAWDRSSPALGGLALTVNVSARELGAPRFVEGVEEVLVATGLPPARLSIELTESSLLADGEHTASTLERLRGLGVGLLVDDFGTGYSTLSYLSRLPLTGLKIDRSFVEPVTRSAKDAAVVSAAIAFGRALGLSVTAEGIERAEQRSRLVELGCQNGQGYLLCPPLPAKSLEARLG